MNDFKIVTDDDRTYECKFVGDKWNIFHLVKFETIEPIGSAQAHADILDKVWWHDIKYRRVESLRKQETDDTIRRMRDYEEVRRGEMI